jgi:membrane associated rhomboid family serine protease
VTTTTFGKRGLTPAAASAAPRSRATAAVVSAAPTSIRRDQERAESFIDRLPIFTVALILFLVCIFLAERRLAFDVGRGSVISYESLLAFGSVSYDRLVGAGEWWRLFLAPLLHASGSHIIGNSVALLFVGLRLEPMIGRAWLAAIFAASAFAGEAGSLFGNAHIVTTLGASGAILGLIGALFVVSLQVADPAMQRRMMWTAARFGLPALLPLLWGASGPVDYCCHAAGFFGGGIAGGLMLAAWPAERPRPNYSGWAAACALTGLVGSIIASGFAATHYASFAERAAQLAPLTQLFDSASPGQTAELASRYPTDPRAQLAEAFVFMKARDWPNAEAKLWRTLDLASSNAAGQPIVNYARAFLAVVVEAEGRRREAKEIAAEACAAGGAVATATRATLERGKLCE